MGSARCRFEGGGLGGYKCWKECRRKHEETRMNACNSLLCLAFGEYPVLLLILCSSPACRSSQLAFTHSGITPRPPSRYVDVQVCTVCVPQMQDIWYTTFIPLLIGWPRIIWMSAKTSRMHLQIIFTRICLPGSSKQAASISPEHRRCLLPNF